MTVRQVALKIEVSVGTVYGLIPSGKLRCYRIGNGRGVVRVSDEHLREYLEGAEPKPIERSPTPRVRLKHLRVS